MIGENLIGKYVVVRTYSAGVHTGILAERDGKECLLKNARRIWYWTGAASLSQLAQTGTTAPEGCKFTVPVNQIILTEAIEIIATTEDGERSIKGVREWKA